MPRTPGLPSPPLSLLSHTHLSEASPPQHIPYDVTPHHGRYPAGVGAALPPRPFPTGAPRARRPLATVAIRIDSICAPKTPNKKSVLSAMSQPFPSTLLETVHPPLGE